MIFGDKTFFRTCYVSVLALIVFLFSSSIVFAADPIIATSSPTSLTATSVTLHGTVTNDGGASTTEAGFRWGYTATLNNVPYTYQFGASSTVPLGSGEAFSQTLTNLIPDTVYYYQVFARNSSGLATSSTLTFRTASSAYAKRYLVEFLGATRTTFTSPDSKGYYWNYGYTPYGGSGMNMQNYGNAYALVDSAGVASGATLKTYNKDSNSPFEMTGAVTTTMYPTGIYGLYYDSTFAPNQHFRMDIGGLDDSYTYRFRLFSSRPGVAAGRLVDFAAAGATWATSTVDSSGNIDTMADINGVVPVGGVARLQVGKNAASNSQYFYINVLEITGMKTNLSPTISVGALSNRLATSITLNGTITDDTGASTTDAGFRWGTTTAYGNVASSTTSLGSGESFSQTLTGLEPGITYHYQVFAINSGGEATSSDQTFTTLSDHFYIDFGDASYLTSDAGWNNISGANSGATTTISSMVNDEDETTSVSLDVCCHWSLTVGGNTLGSGVLDFPASATRDGIYWESPFTTPTNNIWMRMNGLNQHYLYRFRFYSSRMHTDLASRETDFTIGSTTDTIEAYDNVDDYAEINNVSATNGKVDVVGTRHRTAYLAYLNAMEVYGTQYAIAVSTSSPTQVASTSIILNGKVASDGGASTTFAGFEWGTTASYGNIASTTSEKATGDLFSQTLTGLEPNTTYHYRAFVTSSFGNASSSDMTFTTMEAGPFVGPTATVTADDTSIVLPTDTVNLSSSVVDPDGTVTSYVWTEVTSNVSRISATTSATTSVTDLAPGNYTFRLTVTDNHGETDTDDINVTVSAADLTACPAKEIVVLGSSTATGGGATAGNGWVSLYTNYLNTFDSTFSIINLAVGGSDTYSILPTGTTIPAGATAIDTTHNITTAVSNNPNAILINMPTNDTRYVSASTTANYQIFIDYAEANDIPLWIATPQPKSNAYTSRLVDVKDWLTTNYNSSGKLIDFWTGLAESDGSIIQTFDSDGTHLNNTGHKSLYNRVVDSGMIETLCTNQNPSASAGSDASITLPTSSYLLAGETSETDGLIESSLWTQVSGPASATFVDASATSTTVSGLSAAGTYVFRLTATDKWGETSSDNISITVNAAPVVADPTPAVTSQNTGSSASYRVQRLYSMGFVTLADQLARQFNINIDQVNGNGTTPSSSNISMAKTFTRYLQLGNKGEDVRALQRFLNSKGYIISPTGAGSPGKETNLFGALTKRALMRYQKDNKIASTGYFGPVTLFNVLGR